jgi:hypothetical protein
MLDCLRTIESQRSKQSGASFFGTAALKMFSPPDDVHGYADKSISHEMVTEIFLDFANRTRHVESETYLKTLRSKYFDHLLLDVNSLLLMFTPRTSARCGSMDSTFRASGKAVLTDANRQKSKELKGGILSVINEENEIVSWVSPAQY